MGWNHVERAGSRVTGREVLTFQPQGVQRKLGMWFWMAYCTCNGVWC